MEYNFKIPFALNSNELLVAPEDAIKGNRYCCPNCRADLVFKSGSMKAAHFAHQANVSECSPETVLHKTAKLLVAYYCTSPADKPFIHRLCRRCHSRYTVQRVPSDIDNATLETRLSNGLIADVVLWSRNQMRAIVEVRVTHAVDNLKRRKLHMLNTPFIEIRGSDVLDDPLHWHPICARLAPSFCDDCQYIVTALSKPTPAPEYDLPKSYSLRKWRERKNKTT